jgi:hypothetical protein
MDVYADALPAVEETTAAMVAALVLGDDGWQTVCSRPESGATVFSSENRKPPRLRGFLSGCGARIRT